MDRPYDLQSDVHEYHFLKMSFWRLLDGIKCDLTLTQTQREDTPLTKGNSLPYPSLLGWRGSDNLLGGHIMHLEMVLTGPTAECLWSENVISVIKL